MGECPNAQGLPAPATTRRRQAVTEPGHSLGKSVTLLAVALTFLMATLIVGFNINRPAVIRLNIRQIVAVDSTDHGTPAAPGPLGYDDTVIANVTGSSATVRFRVKLDS